MNFSGIKKILVIKLRHIGDVLLSVPVFRALRENFPEAHIAALVNSGTEEVLEASPFIDEILVFDRSIKKMNFSKKYTKEISFLRTIRRKGFDMTVDLTGGDRAAIISFVSGAAHRLGHDIREGFLGKRYLYTCLAKKNNNHHIVLQNLEIVKQSGIKTDNFSVDISIPEDARMFADRILEKNRTDKNTPVVHVHPTSRWLFKCWRDEYMAEVINWLADRGITVIVTSAPDKREMEKAKKILSFVNSRFTAHGSRLLDMCGKTTIKQIAAISEVSDLFFGVDSAPMHIAAAVGTPVIALFGPSGAFHWGPWDNNISNSGNPYPEKNGIQTFGIHTVIQQNRECVPCGKDGCDGSKISRCLTEMKTEEVINILKNKLNLKNLNGKL
jgi:heptosyltransferase-3